MTEQSESNGQVNGEIGTYLPRQGEPVAPDTLALDLGLSVTTDPTTAGLSLVTPSQQPDQYAGHRPWCLDVAAGTADQRDEDGAMIPHPDGQLECRGAEVGVGGTGDPRNTVVTWLTELPGGDVRLVLTGTAVLDRAAGLDLIRQLQQRVAGM